MQYWILKIMNDLDYKIVELQTTMLIDGLSFNIVNNCNIMILK